MKLLLWGRENGEARNIAETVLEDSPVKIGNGQVRTTVPAATEVHPQRARVINSRSWSFVESCGSAPCRQRD